MLFVAERGLWLEFSSADRGSRAVTPGIRRVGTVQAELGRERRRARGDMPRASLKLHLLNYLGGASGSAPRESDAPENSGFAILGGLKHLRKDWIGLVGFLTAKLL